MKGRAWIIWFAGFAALVVALYLLRSILLPFVVGMASAYFLDPAADRLERWGCSRLIATSIITAIFLLVIAGMLVLVVPLLYRQTLDLIGDIPRNAEAIKGLVAWMTGLLEDRLSPEQLKGMRESLQGFSGEAVKWLGGVAGKLLKGGLALFQIVSLFVVTPVVTFYLLNDWDRLVARVDGWLPRRHRDDIRALGRAIDGRLAGFLRGQALVCLALAAFYAIALSLAGLRFGLLVGIASGLLSFIPFVGATLGFVAAVGLALFQFDTALPVIIVAAIFLSGQLIEGALLQPKLVGDGVGLHPVWIIFAVFAGGALLGFLGVLLAVPIAAIIGELVRFTLARYQASPLYTGGGPPSSGGA
ncbi:MAG TPA: AI-2E family transporter [Alphaproteobacteria bacterium]|nr:AI-2E family transporter [Alphaproteobacteria bacterium]